MVDMCWNGCLCIRQEGQLMLEEVRGCVCGAVCHFVVEQALSSAFEEAMRWYAWAVVETGYFVLLHARVCSVQRILPRKECG